MTEVETTVSENPASKWGRRIVLALLIAGLALLLWTYLPMVILLVYTWVKNRDYTHGFVVPFFSGYLLWRNRQQLQDAVQEGVGGGWVRGALLVAAALLLRLLGLVSGVSMIEGLSLLALGAAVATIKWGRPAVRVARPAILYLIFMFPPPAIIASLINAVLYVIMTVIGTFALQTVGVPAISDGNTILLNHGQMEVAEGVGGLYSLLALTVGSCLIMDRMRVEKVIIVISTIPICLAVNTIGIVAAGVAYEYLDPSTANRIFVDVFRWAILPLGLLMLGAVFLMLNRLFVVDD